MFLRPLVGLILLNALCGLPAQAADCGGPVPCPVEGGEYRVALPDGPPRGALVFFHGYRGSAAGQMGAADLVRVAHAHGLAFVAPEGAGGSWSHRGSPSQARDEQAFVRDLLDDLERRFAVAESDVIVGGFSQGASMAFDVACREGRALGGMVSFAGVFWRPLPDPAECAAPPAVVHFHGRGDTVFPLAGRPIGQRAHQGDTFASLDVLRTAAGCRAAESAEERIGGVGCAVAKPCAGGPIALCLHDGGHDVKAAWLDAALDRLGR